MAVRKRQWITLAAALPLAAGMLAVQSGGGGVVRAFDPTKAPEIQDRLLDATADIELGYNSPVTTHPPALHNYSPSHNNQCPVNLDGNVKVNQNCLNVSTPCRCRAGGQAENETSIAINPNNPNQVVATYNDYRRGDGTCGTSYRAATAATSGRTTHFPNGFVLGAPYGNVAREYFQASGDPSTAWTSKGDAYFTLTGVQERGIPTTNNGDFSSAHLSLPLRRQRRWTVGVTGHSRGDRLRHEGGADADRQALHDGRTAMPGSPFQGPHLRGVDAVCLRRHGVHLRGLFQRLQATRSARPFWSAPRRAIVRIRLPRPGRRSPRKMAPCDENQFADPFHRPRRARCTSSTTTTTTPRSRVPRPGNSNNVNQFLIRSRTTEARPSPRRCRWQEVLRPARLRRLSQGTTRDRAPDSGRACVQGAGRGQKDSVFRATNYASGAVQPREQCHRV